MGNVLKIVSIVGLGSAALGIAAAALSPAPGHTMLHMGCTQHNHGPVRTAGEAKRLVQARSLVRLSRPAEE